jgi:hypothetical protein
VSLGVIFLLSRGSEEVVHEEKEPVFSGKSDEVIAITYRMGQDEFRIRKNGAWSKDGDPEAELDQAMADDMLNDLMDIQVVEIVGAISQIDPKEFGLSDPRIVVKLDYESRDPESLIIGGKHPSGRSHYAMMKGGEEFFLIGSIYPYFMTIKLPKLMKP